MQFNPLPSGFVLDRLSSFVAPEQETKPWYPWASTQAGLTTITSRPTRAAVIASIRAAIESLEPHTRTRHVTSTTLRELADPTGVPIAEVSAITPTSTPSASFRHSTATPITPTALPDRPRKRQKVSEIASHGGEPPAVGIHFRYEGDGELRKLQDLLDLHVAPDRRFPPDCDTLLSSNAVRSRYRPDVHENDMYRHVEEFYIIMLEILFLNTLTKSLGLRTFLRAVATLAAHTNDGLPDYSSACHDGKLGRRDHEVLWEIKRGRVLTLKMLIFLVEAARHPNGVVLHLDTIGEPLVWWPMAPPSDLTVRELQNLEFMLQQSINEMDAMGSGRLVLSSWDSFITLRRVSSTDVLLSSIVMRQSEPAYGPIELAAENWTPLKLLFAMLLSCGQPGFASFVHAALPYDPPPTASVKNATPSANASSSGTQITPTSRPDAGQSTGEDQSSLSCNNTSSRLGIAQRADRPDHTANILTSPHSSTSFGTPGLSRGSQSTSSFTQTSLHTSDFASVADMALKSLPSLQLPARAGGLSHVARSNWKSYGAQGMLQPENKVFDGDIAPHPSNSVGLPPRSRRSVPPVEIQLIKHIGSGRLYDVFRCTVQVFSHSYGPPQVQHGVAKIVDISSFVTPPKNRYSYNQDQAMRAVENELRVYRRFPQLAGNVIPRLLSAWILDHCDRKVFVICMEDVGLPLDSKAMSDLQRNLVLELYDQLHDAGLLHEDLQLRHICWQNPSKPFIIDFEGATEMIHGGKHGAARERAMVEEMLRV